MKFYLDKDLAEWMAKHIFGNKSNVAASNNQRSQGNAEKCFSLGNRQISTC